jgi:hypothetical protein
LFVITSDAKSKVSWSKPRDKAALAELHKRIAGQLAQLSAEPKIFGITKDAWVLWDKWYQALPASEHSRRLETIGFRLLALVALTTDKETIDFDTVKIVCRILDYEYNVRVLTDPIDADATVAKLEESIRRQLDRRGPLTDRQLRQYTNANKYGLWAYKAARTNLLEHKDVIFDPKSGTYELMQEARQEA